MNITLRIIAFIALLLAGCGGEKQKTETNTSIVFGVLPALQSLPLVVAQENGFFADAGLDVELIMFNTAAEKDIALTSGAIDGYFGDLFTSTVIEVNGFDIAIVARNYETRLDRRMFGLLAKPGSAYHTASDLINIPIAVSSNSVIEYVAEQLLRNDSVSSEGMAFMEAKNIGLRMQMLLSGQIEAAVLPEPLVTAALSRGGSLLADDSAMSTSQTVLIFAQSFIDDNPKLIKDFLDAIAEANGYINEYPDDVRSLMVTHNRLPEKLRDSYPVPRFPDLTLPSAEIMEPVAAWLMKRKVISRMPSYDELVDGRFIN